MNPASSSPPISSPESLTSRSKGSSNEEEIVFSARKSRLHGNEEELEDAAIQVKPLSTQKPISAIARFFKRQQSSVQKMLDPSTSGDKAVSHPSLFIFRAWLFNAIEEEPLEGASPSPSSSPTPRSARSAASLNRKGTSDTLGKIRMQPANAMQVFVDRWYIDCPFMDADGNVVDWWKLRGRLGGSILHFLWHLKVRYHHQIEFVEIFDALTSGMLLAHPELAALAYSKEPYVGQTLLHMACASSDAELVKILLATGKCDLTQRFTGTFILNMEEEKPEPIRNLDHLVTPLATASRSAAAEAVVAAAAAEVDTEAHRRRSAFEPPPPLSPMAAGLGQSALEVALLAPVSREGLQIQSPNGQRHVEGWYVRLPDPEDPGKFFEAHGQPVWFKQPEAEDVRICYLYSGEHGRWWIGGEKARQRHFEADHGWIASRDFHDGVRPDELETGWERVAESEAIAPMVRTREPHGSAVAEHARTTVLLEQPTETLDTEADLNGHDDQVSKKHTWTMDADIKVLQTSANCSIEIMKLLLRAGADPMVMGGEDPEKPEPLRSILHTVARSRWHGEGPYHVDKARTKAVLRLFLSPMDQDGNPNEFFDTYVYKHPLKPKVMASLPSMPNAAGLTPLQAAAVMGNRCFYSEMLDLSKQFVSRWGNVQEYAFPLEEVDSGATSDALCSLEYLTLYKRGSILGTALMSRMVNDKWRRFGRVWMLYLLFIQTAAALCTAFVCLDNTEGLSTHRWWARLLVFVVVGWHTLFMAVFVYEHRCSSWFGHMGWFPSKYRIGVFDVLAVRINLEMVLMIIIVVTVPWYHRDWVKTSPEYDAAWHILASCWWFYFFVHMFRYFELFQATAALGSALPTITTHDIGPWLLIYSVIFLTSSVALRCATTMTVNDLHSEQIVGSWVRTAMSLEESIHGPDVRWRSVVDHHNGIAGSVLIAFLWLTLTMMTMLISMVSSRYADIKDHVYDRFIHRRATECITVEKLMPQWFHQRMSFDIGSRRLGDWFVRSNLKNEHYQRLHSQIEERASQRRCFLPTASRGKMPERLSESSPLLGDDRWLLVKNSQRLFKQWQLPVQTKTRWL